MEEVLRTADKVVVPLSPSIFDMYATRAFLDELAQHRKAGRMQVGIVGTRVDPRTIAADKLQEFTDKLGLPVLGFLRPTQNYVHLAARGLTLSDLSPAKVGRDLEQWQGIHRWLDA
jgi:chromosome partitioning protein